MISARERRTRTVDCGGFTRERSVCDTGHVYSDSIRLRSRDYARSLGAEGKEWQFTDEAALRRLIADATELLAAWEESK